MRLVSLRSIAAALLASSTVNAQSLLSSINYQDTLEIYYYFRTGEGSVTVNNDGLVIDVPSTEELCSVLSGAQIVYSADSQPDVLLTSNCLSVYSLVDTSNQPITWTSCEEFSFFDTLCSSTSPESSSLPSTSSALSSTNASEPLTSDSIPTTTSLPLTNTAIPTFISNDETLVLTTVTTTIDDIVTTYTTLCPLTTDSDDGIIGYTTDTIVSTHNGIITTKVTDVPVSYIKGKPESRVVIHTITDEEEESVLTTVTSTVNGQVTVYTTYCPVSSDDVVVSTKEAAPSSVVTDVLSTETETQTVIKTASGSAAPAPAPDATTEQAKTKVEVSTVTKKASETVVETDVIVVTKPASDVTAPAPAPSGTSITSVIQQSTEKVTTATAEVASSTFVAVSTFEGSAAKLVGSLSIVALGSVFVGLFF